MNRKSRSITRRSSILKIDRDDDTGIIGGRNRRSSRRVSFAEMCQIKEFQKDSPKVFKDLHPDDNNDGNHTDSSSNNHGITGLDKLLTGAIQTPYQDVAEYPIPEMSSESFNIFDFNKTVTDHVDMDTTEAAGGIESFYPEMDFQSEHSMEIKFDAKSFLQSLQGNSSDSLKTLQIYSPKRDRYLQEQASPDNQMLPIQFNNMGPDKENMVPMDTLQSFRNSDSSPEALKYFDNEEPTASFDSRMFLQRIFGEKSKKLEETKHDVEAMEETACIDVKLTEVNEGHTNRSSGPFTVDGNVTKYFNAEDITVGIEETKCIGGIISEAASTSQNADANKENMLFQPNQTVHMEETRPIGGILKSGHDTIHMEETKPIGGILKSGHDTVHMEETKPIGGILKSGHDTVHMEETKPIGGILKSGHDTVHLEETKPIGGILKSGHDTVHMEETRPIGGILKSGHDTVHMEETKPIGGILKSGHDTVHMEETKPIGGILKSGHDEVHMEETKPIGGILKSGQDIVHMEETKPIGGILKSCQDTVHMEETKPIGGILKVGLDTTIQTGLRMKEGFDASINSYDNVTRCFKMEEDADDGIEETKCVGGILSKVDENSDKTSNENEVSRIKQSGSIQSLQESEQVRTYSPLDTTKQEVFSNVSPSTNVLVNFNVNNIQDNMRATKDFSEIPDRTENQIKSVQTSDLDKTANDSIAMEETKAVGGLLDKTAANVTIANSLANNLGDKTVDYTVAMEETKAVGGILDKTNKIVEKNVDGMENIGSNITLNQTAPIEETKTVGGILNKTSEQTMYFDEVKTDWTSNDLKGSNVCGKAADGTTIEVVNKSAVVDETKCVGGILSDGMETMKENIYNYANVEDTGNKTLIEPVHMEETKCVTNVFVNEICPVNTDKGESKSLEKYKDEKIDENSSFKDSQSKELEVDDEITFKVSNKRNFDECRGELFDKTEEKTKDFTQNQTNLAKLKEMLILSKRKTAAQVRQGDIRTLSKFSPLFPGSAPQSSTKAPCCSQLDLSVTRSPVNKRQRLSEHGLGDDNDTDNDFGSNERTEATEATAALLGGFKDDMSTTGLLESSRMQDTDLEGIDDELMPDTLHHDLCNLNSSSDTHSDKNSTVCSDRVSTTMYENTETQSSGNDTRSSASNNISMYSNKSTLSFIAPEGPMTLESFFKLTFKPSPKVQGARCSTIFTPRLDLDDLTEVLHAELTLEPQVNAKKKLIAYFTQLIEKSKANMEWLEKSLEETQPEIFQLCSKASSEELKKIIGQLGSLVSACHNEADTAWKRKSKEIFTEALEDIQVDGVRRAEEMLEKNKTDNMALDDLLTSLDQDLESLDKKEQELEELQLIEEKLNMEMKKLSISLQEKTVEESELQSQLQNKSKIGETYDVKKQEIVSHLICCEWNLEELEEDMAVFTFLDEKIKLSINFILGAEEKQISNITLEINVSSKNHCYLEDRVAYAFVLNGINTDSLKQRFTTYSSLPKLLHEVSVSINEIRMFCKDLENINIHNMLKVEDNSISTELWDRNTMDFINASFIFDPTHPLTHCVESKVRVKIGTLKSQFIEDRLKEVTPGPGYLSRLIEAVNFKQLRNDSSMVS